MSFLIPLQAVPNQSLSTVVDGISYELKLNSTSNITAVTVIRDNVTILTGARVVAGTPIFPYEYLEDGNFIFLTPDDNLPYYTNFGITQFLMFYTNAELGVLRDNT